MESTLDVSKYGFKLTKESDSGIKHYMVKLNNYSSALLVVVQNNYTLYSVFNKDITDSLLVANRYECYSQQDLDFLIYRGRIGCYFPAGSRF